MGPSGPASYANGSVAEESQPGRNAKETIMKNFILTVWHVSGTTGTETATVLNLGRWNWNANEAQCGADVKRAAFVKLAFRFPDFFWSYEGDGWIQGDPKPGTQMGPIQAFLSMGLTDIVL